ncbi:MAG: YhcN/YlaJ family sporulation lipoprotein [Clostridia bacterium]|nr:YhcN/YlaJ family sporulation lipoprotein [Clostridia bacterium]
MMSLKRKGFLIMGCVLLAGVVLAGCMNAGGRLSGANDGQNSQAPVPETTGGASVMPQATSALQNAYDWVTGRTAVEEKINLLSEIETSRVITTGSTALVGVTFAKEYQGEMTQRIQNLIAGVVKEADPSIQVVAVTSEKEDVDTIFSIADQLGGGALDADAESRVDTIVRNVTTMQ